MGQEGCGTRNVSGEQSRFKSDGWSIDKHAQMRCYVCFLLGSVPLHPVNLLADFTQIRQQGRGRQAEAFPLVPIK